ncbi:hypothetical protein L228DRAFT_249218 [Xylona heveae TC161]|uniref:Mso1 N-terminal domain-containing protein n=1 Tax=Xylona heveae (strain CBS 132557 / TC161) TaxID=1328760 RepID=A0A165FUQ6_XYLHT|nr:hypothetical protein L228DRAFT_249218 [Xylona heveae TC161]KZF21404.1 hypothetical protein L228DRAFT_249218 [Xylona heveae TC161]
MSSYLTYFSSRYNSIRRNLLSDENDGDTEDDTHISRVLRAYYIEKGRPFPPWLPPDPKAPQVQPAQYVAMNSRQGSQQMPPRGSTGGLGDLWDAPQRPPATESLSLRKGGAMRGAAGRGASPRPSIVDSYTPASPVEQARPLPSQRAGSYQAQFPPQQAQRNDSFVSATPSSGSGSGLGAQERLKARFRGGGSSSSASSASTYGVQNQRFAGGYDGQGGSADRPFVGATSPWVSGDPGPPVRGYGGGEEASSGGKFGLFRGQRTK